MKTHDIRHRLTTINRRILLAREFCTQITVLNELDGLVTDICNLGDDLDKPEKEKDNGQVAEVFRR